MHRRRKKKKKITRKSSSTQYSNDVRQSLARPTPRRKDIGSHKQGPGSPSKKGKKKVWTFGGGGKKGACGLLVKDI